MEVEFDKEIDAILRKARGGEVVASFDSHLDADEISAFAENALSEPSRRRYTAHLADCARCRKILSNTIVLNSEAETETASSGVSAETIEASVPWYRKLFVFPQIAYTMGAMVLLFSGFFGYLILQNLSGSKNADVGFSTDKPAPARESAPSAVANTAANSSNTNAVAPAPMSNAASTNSTANAPAPLIAPAATPGSSASNTNAAMPSAPTDRKGAEPELNAPVMQTTPGAEIPAKDEIADDRAAPKPQAGATTLNKQRTTDAVREETAKNDEKKRARDDVYRMDKEEDSNLAQPKTKAAPLPAKKQPYGAGAGATRSVGGKTFNNIGGIWFDSDYTKQKQKTVRRGTSDYQKLDAGLRSIADSFSGTVVVLWSGKAYRIQ